MFHVIAGCLAIYVVWRLVWRQSWPAPVRSGLVLSILLASQHHLITRTFFGSMASPEVPGMLLMVFNWAFGALVLTGVALLALDVIGVFAWLLFRGAGRRILSARRARAAIGSVALVLAAIGVWQAVRVPDVRQVEIALAQLPTAFDGVRIVQLTDLHASRLLQRPRMEAVVARTNALKPDLIVLTGDMVDGTVAARRDDVEPLRTLAAPLGVYAIAGNHEYYAEYSEWLAHLAQLDLQLLLNENVRIERGGASFVLAGITDRVAARYEEVMPNVQAALAGAAPDDVVVLLSHRPVNARAHAQAGANVQLSGHTHGGQVLGLHWLVRAFNEGYESGLYDVDGMQMYVSHGAGLWAGFAMRLGRASEITEITLRAIPAAHESAAG